MAEIKLMANQEVCTGTLTVDTDEHGYQVCIATETGNESTSISQRITMNPEAARSLAKMLMEAAREADDTIAEMAAEAEPQPMTLNQALKDGTAF